MGRRILIAAILTILFSYQFPANASGFFPTSDELFGVTMPSLAFAIDRSATKVEETNDGVRECYENFTDEDYLSFGNYATIAGCKVVESSKDDGVLTVVVSKESSSFTFTYDRKRSVATVYYPSDTRIEQTHQEPNESTENTFPLINEVFGIGLPSMKTIVGHEADDITKISKGRTKLTFVDISTKTYQKIGQYLSCYDGVVLENKTVGNKITTDIQIDDVVIQAIYDVDTNTLAMIYPTLHYINDIPFEDAGDGLFPDIDETFSMRLPRIASVIWRPARKKEGTTDGGYMEVYNNFSEEDYNSFSKYLVEQECTVSGYTTEGNILAIELEKEGIHFSLLYNPDDKTATMIYPAGSHPEPEATPTPKPLSESKPTTTTSPSAANVREYSEDDCWSVAEDYFYSLSWKNPKSVTLHSHTSTYSDGGYLFLIDYSAQNGFGGYNRETYCIKVNAQTKKIEYATSF